MNRIPITVVAGAIFGLGLGVALAAFTSLGAVEGIVGGVVVGAALGLIGAFVTRLRTDSYRRME